MRPPDDWRRARVTLAIAALTALAWLLVEGSGRQLQAVNWGGFSAYRFFYDGYAPGVWVWLTPLSATLIHAGFLHLAFNLLMLLFCGRAVENILGPVALAILYVTGAYAAAAAQYAFDPNATVPMVGASGAVSAVIGAYAILFGRNRVSASNVRLAEWLNALWLMAGWVGLQLLIGFISRMGPLDIAIAAHIGGFLAGLLLERPLLLFRYRKA
jgi:membrane associated rhomboid family serine protease